jgi:hypothetical protein
MKQRIFQPFILARSIVLDSVSNDSGVGTRWYMITITLGELLLGITK